MNKRIILNHKGLYTSRVSLLFSLLILLCFTALPCEIKAVQKQLKVKKITKCHSAV